MGVRDYISIIQRYKQNILPLFDDGCGATSAIIVLVPNTHSKEEILGWKLTEFANFKYIESRYDWNDWDFKDVEGYRHISLEERSDGEWWDLAIWESPTHPNMYLVNFEPDEYKAFVLGKINPEKISRQYYLEVFDDRNLDMPTPKSEAYKKIVDFGVENLFEYHKKELPGIRIPNDYIQMMKKIKDQKILFSSFIYRLENPPPELSRARLAILIKDNIGKHPHKLFIPAASSGLGNESGFCKSYSPEEATFKFTLYPSLIIEIDEKLLDGCVVCSRRRWTGEYVCYNHISHKSDLDMKAHLHKIEKNASNALQNLKEYNNAEIPLKLRCSFEERGKEYNLQLFSVDRLPQSKLREKYGYSGSYRLDDSGYAKVVME